MTIYVDDLEEWVNGSGKWCHMVTDGPIEELHQFARSIGLRLEWFQDKKIPHYDLRESKRILAIQKGAKEVSSEYIIKMMETRK